MFVVMNQHFTFFQTGVFSFLDESFIMNTFGEAEERPTRQPRIGGRLHDGVRLSDARRRKEQDALIVRHRLNDRLGLTQCDRRNTMIEICLDSIIVCVTVFPGKSFPTAFEL